MYLALAKEAFEIGLLTKTLGDIITQAGVTHVPQSRLLLSHDSQMDARPVRNDHLSDEHLSRSHDFIC